MGTSAFDNAASVMAIGLRRHSETMIVATSIISAQYGMYILNPRQSYRPSKVKALLSQQMFSVNNVVPFHGQVHFESLFIFADRTSSADADWPDSRNWALSAVRSAGIENLQEQQYGDIPADG